MSNKLVPVEPTRVAPEDAELIPGYYACRIKNDPFEVGDLVYLLELVEGRVSILRGEHQWTMPQAAFRVNFAFDPEGVVHRAGEMAALMSEIAELQQTVLRAVSYTHLTLPTKR